MPGDARDRVQRGRRFPVSFSGHSLISRDNLAL